ncbi:unnamed protein product [Mytilus coruscus]|uniref:Uncharacterized protein n=1 Tax=Mytilus coruscus TaxID=42192 RepID=A0A6J8ETK7_MYTCO|nr:unnamed protein product [Mytilus coruscus]
MQRPALQRETQDLPALPTSLADTTVDDEWAETTTGQPFLLADDNTNGPMLVFSTKENLIHLAAADSSYCDGTFYVVIRKPVGRWVRRRKHRSHSKCFGIKPLASVVEKVKIEKIQQSVERDINSFSHFLDKILNTKLKNVKTGEHQYINQKSIEDIRNEINKHLDYLEEKLSQDLDTFWNQEKSTAKDFISECKGRKKILKEIKDHLQTVMSNDSKLQSCLGIQQIEQQVYQCQIYIDDLETDDRAKEFDIKLTQNSEIENI